MNQKHPAVEDLSRIPLLAGLPDEARRLLCDRFEIEDVRPGQRLVEEGRSGYAFYVLDRGRPLSHMTARRSACWVRATSSVRSPSSGADGARPP